MRPRGPLFSLGRIVALVFVLGLAGVGVAQLLADVMVSTAIIAELNPAIRLPHGTLRAVGPGDDAIIARVPDYQSWIDWEVFAATGLTVNLQGAFVHNLATEFAVAGLFQNSLSERQVGAETHTRYEFDDGVTSALLYVIRTPQEPVWMIARKP